MNILLWVLQAILGFLYGAGGYYKASHAGELAGQFPAIPAGGWRALGALELIGAVLLILPAAMRWMPTLTPLAAALLTVETLALCAVYARYSLKLTAENPLGYALVMTALAAFVAYGRYALERLG